ncbi:polysaccharide biosynthesis protein [Peribacillus cavernae]|uniref:Polysaccharide biosynthesis protein n=1 Tax=Peribacillus cavernae TaxID=1674310 RepID=A0A3S0W8R0_9BACI|nr:oligosaccharide flippase family protein [Peribacillus cavernae]MDQ0217479.1 O-antigen/teichoic acid export membrane protein [Peribacillus cavernae]RUQ30078.1 polysaccharide biosynthesis protein [Peribacillus cavernae]
MRNQLKAGAVLSYIALFISSVISIIYTPVMLNILGQSEFGLFSLATSTAAFVGVLNFGLGNAVIRYTAKYKALKDEEGCYNLYGMFFIMYGILGIVALIAGIVLSFNSHILFSNSLTGDEIHTLKSLMRILVVNTSVGIGLGLFSVLMLAHEKFIFSKVVGILSSIINPLVMLPFLVMGYGSIGMVVITTIINLTTILINMIYCFKILKIKIRFKALQRGLFKEVIIFSSLIFLNMIIGQIYWSTDQIILGMYSGTVAIAVYSIGVSFSGYFSGFSAGISNVFLSRVTTMVTNKANDSEISELFIRIGRVQFVIISLALSGFIVFGQEFINLWVGRKYHDSFLIAMLILTPMVIPLIQGMGGVILQAKNMHKFKTIVNFALALANVILSIIFVQWWGAIGCALATAISFTIGNIIITNIYYWKKINIDIPKFWFNIFCMSAPFFTSVLLGTITNKLFIADNWLLFFIKILMFIGAYSILMWTTGMNRYEKDLVIVPLKSIIDKFRKQKLHKVS